MRGRPRARNELRQLLASREPLYRQADVTVDTSGRTASAVVDDLLAHAAA
jgi:shikimate kinase